MSSLAGSRVTCFVVCSHALSSPLWLSDLRFFKKLRLRRRQEPLAPAPSATATARRWTKRKAARKRAHNELHSGDAATAGEDGGTPTADKRIKSLRGGRGGRQRVFGASSLGGAAREQYAAMEAGGGAVTAPPRRVQLADRPAEGRRGERRHAAVHLRLRAAAHETQARRRHPRRRNRSGPFGHGFLFFSPPPPLPPPNQIGYFFFGTAADPRAAVGSYHTRGLAYRARWLCPRRSNSEQGKRETYS
jgi:hypothetical protein